MLEQVLSSDLNGIVLSQELDNIILKLLHILAAADFNILLILLTTLG